MESQDCNKVFKLIGDINCGDLRFEIGIGAFRKKFEPKGNDLSQEAGVWSSRLGYEPLGKDLCLEAGIGVLRLGFKPLKGG